MGDPRSWSDVPEAFEEALKANGAVALPNPPIQMPAWLKDLRDKWVVEGAKE